MAIKLLSQVEAASVGGLIHFKANSTAPTR
jgi:hypothetical protein